MNNFSKNIRHLRKKNHFTQADMELHLSIGNTTWSHYENDISEPAIEALIRISNFFGVTLNELLVEDLAEKDGHVVIPQQQHKPYARNEAYSKMEDQKNNWDYVLKEVRKLRKEVNAIKQSGRKKLSR